MKDKIQTDLLYLLLVFFFFKKEDTSLTQAETHLIFLSHN